MTPSIQIKEPFDPISIQPGRSDPFRIHLNWDAYFAKFIEVHGEPVRFRGRLLFPDGWFYSLRDKAGPEWPPPSDPKELNQLLVSYWLIRLQWVQVEYRSLQQTILNLREAQRLRSAPLQQTVVLYDDDGRLAKISVADVNVDDLEQGRLAWLREDIYNCQIKLQELNHDRTTR